MAEPLENCAHCGAPGYLITSRTRGLFKVKCTGCEMQTKGRECRADVVRIWNTRLVTERSTPDDGLVDELIAAVMACASVTEHGAILQDAISAKRAVRAALAEGAGDG